MLCLWLLLDGAVFQCQTLGDSLTPVTSVSGLRRRFNTIDVSVGTKGVSLIPSMSVSGLKRLFDTIDVSVITKASL